MLRGWAILHRYAWRLISEVTLYSIKLTMAIKHYKDACLIMVENILLPSWLCKSFALIFHQIFLFWEFAFLGHDVLCIDIFTLHQWHLIVRFCFSSLRNSQLNVPIGLLVDWWTLLVFVFQVEDTLSEVEFQLKVDLHFTDSEQQWVSWTSLVCVGRFLSSPYTILLGLSQS